MIIVKNNCPNCNYPESHDYIRGYQICINCGVAFLKGYTEENLAKYYSSGEYRAKYKQPNEVAHQTRRAENIVKYVGTPSVYIDIGCSYGILLDKVQASEKYGVDHDKHFEGVFPYLSDVPQKADCITLIHSLEHMISPLAMLREVYNKLNDNGRVVIEVPNGSVNNKGEYYIGAFAFPHVSMFSDKSLAWTMRESGFEIEKMEIHGNGGLIGAPEWYYLLMTGKKG